MNCWMKDCMWKLIKSGHVILFIACDVLDEQSLMLDVPDEPRFLLSVLCSNNVKCVINNKNELFKQKTLGYFLYIANKWHTIHNLINGQQWFQFY